jgi:hypothetical protein
MSWVARVAGWGKRAWSGARQQRLALAVGSATAIAAFLLAWLATAPTASMGINWDTSGFAIELGRGSPWSRLPWNSHYGVGHVYWLAVHAGARLGLSTLDSLRVLNGLALTASVLIVYVCALRLRVPAPLAAVTAAVYATAWGTLILVFTWEDNLLFHPGALAALTVGLLRVGDWRARDSLAAGLFAGLSSLMSWQGAAFALPAMVAAGVLAQPRRPAWQRLGYALLVPAALAATRFAWVTVYWLTTRGMTFGTLLVTAFEQPSPSFMPRGLGGWLALPGRWREILAHVGLGVAHELGPAVRDSPALPQISTLLGALFIAATAAACVAVAIGFRRRVGRPARFLATAFIVVTLSAAVYLDLPIDKYKRYDFIPMFVSLGLVLAVAVAVARGAGRRTRVAVTAGIVALAVGQLAVGWHFSRSSRAHLGMPAAIERAAQGRTWFGYLRGLRRAAPQACAFVFAFDELRHADRNLEILAALVSELPNPIVFDDRVRVGVSDGGGAAAGAVSGAGFSPLDRRQRAHSSHIPA